MKRRIVGRLVRDRRGAAIVEFAMTALWMVLLLVGAVELGIVFWTWQALEETAFEAARCAAINGTSCKNVATTPASTANYAATVAQARGLSTVTSSNVTISTGAGACGTTTATVVSVTLSYQFSSGFLASLPTSISASACFPLINTS